MSPEVNPQPEVRDKIRWYTDSDHEWLAVPVAYVLAAGVASAISKYSYIDRATALVYLEGDCDAERYQEAAMSKGLPTEPVETVYCGRQAFIRRLPTFSLA